MQPGHLAEQQCRVEAGQERFSEHGHVHDIRRQPADRCVEQPVADEVRAYGQGEQSRPGRGRIAVKTLARHQGGHSQPEGRRGVDGCQIAWQGPPVAQPPSHDQVGGGEGGSGKGEQVAGQGGAAEGEIPRPDAGSAGESEEDPCRGAAGRLLAQHQGREAQGEKRLRGDEDNRGGDGCQNSELIQQAKCRARKIPAPAAPAIA